MQGEGALVAGVPWWRQPRSLARFVSDLVAAELSALRHETVLPGDHWNDELSLDHDLGLDSLELMHVAVALADVLQMRRCGIEDYLLARRTLGDWGAIANASLDVFSTEMGFRTSGSTGIPKLCAHPLASLEREAQAIAARVGPRRRVLLAVPGHHIYGFICGHLLPRYLNPAGCEVVGIQARLPARLARLAAPGDLVIGHPQFWQLALCAGQSMPEDVVGISSTAPCPPGVAQAALRAGLSVLFELYGSTETGGVGWRARHDDAYRLWPYLEREPQGGVLARGSDGAAKVLPVQDVLEWHGERSFRVNGRRDGAVQVGGINVFPQRVREVLLSHPEVKDAAVRLMRQDEGARLKAFVVPASDGDRAGLVARLRRWIDQVLPAPERPKAITVGAELPRGPLGKALDWKIGEER